MDGIVIKFELQFYVEILNIEDRTEFLQEGVFVREQLSVGWHFDEGVGGR